jgi:hypothetical protein
MPMSLACSLFNLSVTIQGVSCRVSCAAAYAGDLTSRRDGDTTIYAGDLAFAFGDSPKLSLHCTPDHD